MLIFMGVLKSGKEMDMRFQKKCGHIKSTSFSHLTNHGLRSKQTCGDWKQMNYVVISRILVFHSYLLGEIIQFD